MRNAKSANSAGKGENQPGNRGQLLRVAVAIAIALPVAHCIGAALAGGGEQHNEQQLSKEKDEKTKPVFAQEGEKPATQASVTNKDGDDTLAEGRRLDGVSCGLYNQGKYAEAIPPLLRSTEIYKKRLGPNHYYVGDNFTHIADMYYKQKNYDSAERYYREAMVVFEKCGGSCQAHGCIDNLSTILRASGREKEADELQSKVKNGCPKPAQ